MRARGEERKTNARVVPLARLNLEISDIADFDNSLRMAFFVGF
jgi:hypothetical protein